MPYCFGCGKDGVKKNNCPNCSKNKPKRSFESNYNHASWFNMVTFHNKLEKINMAKVKFCLDSGSTCHSTGTKSILSNIQTTEEFTFENSFKDTAKGNTKGNINAKVGSDRTVTIHDVLYAPKMQTNLLSVHQLTTTGCDVLFSKDEAKILRNGQVTHTMPFNGQYYEVELDIYDPNNTSKEVNTPVNYNIKSTQGDLNNEYTTHINGMQPYMGDIERSLEVHLKLGHCSYTHLKQLLSKNLIHGVEKNFKLVKFDCPMCIAANLPHSEIHKQMHPNAEVYKAKEPLAKLHLDLVGPFETLPV